MKHPMKTLTYNSFSTLVSLVFFLTNGRECVVWGNSFHAHSHSGHISPDAYKSKLNVRSSTECALICLNDRGANPECAAFGYWALETSCSLYAMDTTRRYPERDDLYMFEVPASFHYSTYMGHRYAYHTSTFKAKIHAARAHCFSIGAYLAQMDSAEEYEAVVAGTGGRVISEYHYIGATDEAVEGQWVNDLDGTALRYNLKWRPGDPDNENVGRTPANCASVIIFGTRIRVHDKTCHVKRYYFLCEKDVV